MKTSRCPKNTYKRPRTRQNWLATRYQNPLQTGDTQKLTQEQPPEIASMEATQWRDKLPKAQT